MAEMDRNRENDHRVRKLKNITVWKEDPITTEHEDNCERTNIIAELKNIRNILANRMRSQKYPKDIPRPEDSKELVENETNQQLQAQPENQEWNIISDCKCLENDNIQDKVGEKDIKDAKKSEFIKMAQKHYNEVTPECSKFRLPCNRHSNFKRKSLIRNAKMQTTGKKELESKAKRDLAPVEMSEDGRRQVNLVREPSQTSIGTQMNPNVFLSKRLRQKITKKLKQELGKIDARWRKHVKKDPNYHKLIL